MRSFLMGDYIWHVQFVRPDSELLVDRTGNVRVATTDPVTLCVYISDALNGDFLDRVLIHELGHCALFSFNIVDDIHRMVRKECWIEAEEWVCNLIADYGRLIFSIAGEIRILPHEIELFIG